MPYTPELKELIKKVEATRAERVERKKRGEEVPFLSLDERKERLKFHPDFKEEGRRELKVGPSKGYAIAHEIADLLEATSRVAPDKIDLSNPAYETDVLIIGGGGAGTSAAILAQEQGAKVIIATKLRHGDANTMMAEGGIQAATKGEKDSPYYHYLDVMGGGHFTNVPGAGRDAGQERARRHPLARALRRQLLQGRRRPARDHPRRRHLAQAHALRGRHHRRRDHAHHPRRGAQPRRGHHGARVLAGGRAGAQRARPLRRRGALQHGDRGVLPGQGQVRDPGHRRLRPAPHPGLHDHQPLRRHRRRHRPRLPRRRAGVLPAHRPVPPDRRRLPGAGRGHSHHREVPRRRRQPGQRRGQPVRQRARAARRRGGLDHQGVRRTTASACRPRPAASASGSTRR